MDHAKFSTIAHANHVFCSPLSTTTADRLLALLNLQPGQRVLDVGCGKAELLIRAIEQYGVVGVGIDTNAQFLQEAQQRAAGRVPADSLVLYHAAITDVALAPQSFDAAFCVGSTQAYGDYRTTLRALKQIVRRGGYLVIGEGYWRRSPDPAYLQFLGAQATDYAHNSGNIAIGEVEGLRPLRATTSSEAEWEEYEGLYARTIEQYVAEHPDDPDNAELLEQIRAWRAAYERWGRATLGFGLYVFQVP